jgi:hypothetical protein
LLARLVENLNYLRDRDRDHARACRPGSDRREPSGPASPLHHSAHPIRPYLDTL